MVLGRGKADKDRYARPKRRSDHASPSGRTRSVSDAPPPPPLTGPPSPPPITPQPQVRMYRQPIPSSRGLFGLSVGLRLAIAVVVIAAVAIPLISVGNTVSDLNLPSASPAVTQAVSTSPAPATPGASKPVSYLTPAGVRAGLRLLARRVPGARLDQVRLAATSLIASARLRTGAFREVVIGPTGTIVTSGASTGERLFSFSAISPGAVARIVSEMRHRFHVSASQIDYMVTAPTFAGGTQWVLFAKTPGHPGFTAALTGERLRRLPS